MEIQNISLIKGYHAHIYFDQSTFDQATVLCEEAGKLFKVTVGRMHCKPIGPHPCWSCQLAFEHSEYTNLGSSDFIMPKNLRSLKIKQNKKDK